jgi:hypothetical protein
MDNNRFYFLAQSSKPGFDWILLDINESSHDILSKFHDFTEKSSFPSRAFDSETTVEPLRKTLFYKLHDV